MVRRPRRREFSPIMIHVRRLAEKSSVAPWKKLSPTGLMHLHLIDSRQQVFPPGSSTVMILRSGRLMKMQAGIKRRTFLPDPVGPGDEQDFHQAKPIKRFECLLVVGEKIPTPASPAAILLCPELRITMDSP